MQGADLQLKGAGLKSSQFPKKSGRMQVFYVFKPRRGKKSQFPKKSGRMQEI